MLKIRARSKQFSSTLTLMILLFRWTMVTSGLPLVAIRQWPIGIFTEWTAITSLSKALNLEFEWATFSKTHHITFEVIWSFLLKLIYIALSCTLSSLLIPTISESIQFRKAYSNRSVTLARKWDVGFESSHTAARDTP